MEQQVMVADSCRGCGNAAVAGDFCNVCGEYLIAERFTFKKIIQSIPDIFFDVEHGLFYTIKELFKNPAATVSSFLNGNRARHYKPLKFLLFMSGLYALLFIYFNIHSGGTLTQDDLFEQQVTRYQSIINVIALPFLSLTSWLIFGYRKMYYGEHLVINSFIIGFILFVQIILFPVMLIKNGTAWVDWIMTVVVFYTIYFCNRTYYGLFHKKSLGDLIISILQTLAVIFLFVIWEAITNPIIIYLKIALVGE